MGELTMFRALDELRCDHTRAMEREGEKMREWVKDSHKAEKECLLKQLAGFRKSTTSPGGSFTVETTEHVCSGSVSVAGCDEVRTCEDSRSEEGETAASVSAATEVVSLVSPVSSSAEVVVLSSPETVDLSSSTTVSWSPATTIVTAVLLSTGDRVHLPALSPTAKDFIPTSAVVTSSSVIPKVPTLVAGTSHCPGGVPVGVDAVPGVSEPDSSVIETFSRLLKAQAYVMAAQVKAAAVQNLPSLTTYTGEGGDAIDDGFERWVECFRERARFADWSAEDQLYRLKLHLGGTALNVFRMLPDSERKKVDSALQALKKRFKPADIEELRGLEFHHRTQREESIEQLGISIQQLGRKAFPTIIGKDFDRLLKGRFYQALLVKWRRKLGSPKPDESFHDLYARARMLEEHEKQFTVSACARPEATKKSSGNIKKFSQVKPKEKQIDIVSRKPPEKPVGEFVPLKDRQYQCRCAIPLSCR